MTLTGTIVSHAAHKQLIHRQPLGSGEPLLPRTHGSWLDCPTPTHPLTTSPLLVTYPCPSLASTPTPTDRHTLCPFSKHVFWLCFKTNVCVFRSGSLKDSLRFWGAGRIEITVPMLTFCEIPPPCNLPPFVVTVPPTPQGGGGRSRSDGSPTGGGGGLHHKTVP